MGTTLRSVLVGIWQRRSFKIPEIICLLKSVGTREEVVEAIEALDRKEVSVNEVEEVLRRSKDEKTKEECITC